MKKKILFVALVLVAAAASFQWSTKQEKLDSLMLENIEALALIESDESEFVTCVGKGSVDCPISNVKVYIVKKSSYYSLR